VFIYLKTSNLLFQIYQEHSELTDLFPDFQHQFDDTGGGEASYDWNQSEAIGLYSTQGTNDNGINGFNNQAATSVIVGQNSFVTGVVPQNMFQAGGNIRTPAGVRMLSAVQQQSITIATTTSVNLRHPSAGASGGVQIMQAPPGMGQVVQRVAFQNQRMESGVRIMKQSGGAKIMQSNHRQVFQTSKDVILQQNQSGQQQQHQVINTGLGGGQIIQTQAAGQIWLGGVGNQQIIQSNQQIIQPNGNVMFVPGTQAPQIMQPTNKQQLQGTVVQAANGQRFLVQGTPGQQINLNARHASSVQRPANNVVFQQRGIAGGGGMFQTRGLVSGGGMLAPNPRSVVHVPEQGPVEVTMNPDGSSGGSMVVQIGGQMYRLQHQTRPHAPPQQVNSSFVIISLEEQLMHYLNRLEVENGVKNLKSSSTQNNSFPYIKYFLEINLK